MLGADIDELEDPAMRGLTVIFAFLTHRAILCPEEAVLRQAIGNPLVLNLKDQVEAAWSIEQGALDRLR